MGNFVKGKEEARAKAMASLAAVEARAAKNIERLCVQIDDHIKARTPVWSGQAVRNYIWTFDNPNMMVHDAIDNGEPGPTNSMPLGAEPRRGPNEAAARESLTGLDFGNPFRPIFLTNLSPDITGLELGTLPGPPLSSRSPNGMFGLTHGYITTLLAAKGILS